MTKSKLITVRTPYRISKLPIIFRLYRYAYDFASLSTPRLISGRRTPARILFFLVYSCLKPIRKIIKAKINAELIFTTSSNGNTESRIIIDIMNLQYHAIYFKRFANGYEPEVCAILEMLFLSKEKKDKNFYDIGANWGFYVGYVASIAGFAGRIIAFEPNKEVYNDLLQLSSAANMQQVLCINNALSNQDTKGKIIAEDQLHSGLGYLKITAKGTIQVKSLDSLLPELAQAEPYVIKIDAEGSEFAILEGAKETIIKYQPYVIFELGVKNEEPKLIFELLKQLNYQIYRITFIAVNNHNNCDKKENTGSIAGKLTINKIDINYIEHIDKKINVFSMPKDAKLPLIS